MASPGTARATRTAPATGTRQKNVGRTNWMRNRRTGTPELEPNGRRDKLPKRVPGAKESRRARTGGSLRGLPGEVWGVVKAHFSPPPSCARRLADLGVVTLPESLSGKDL